MWEFFFDFGSQNGDLWCILAAIFYSSAKTLRGRKDTLAQVYFYWGGQSPPSPPGIDATACCDCVTQLNMRQSKVARSFEAQRKCRDVDADENEAMTTERRAAETHQRRAGPRVPPAQLRSKARIIEAGNRRCAGLES